MGTAHQQPQNHQTLELPPLETRPPREKTQQSLVYNHETLTAADVGERTSKETGRSCSRARVPSRKRVLGCLLRGVVSASSLPAGVVIKWFCRRAREEGRARAHVRPVPTLVGLKFFLIQGAQEGQKTLPKHLVTVVACSGYLFVSSEFEPCKCIIYSKNK